MPTQEMNKEPLKLEQGWKRIDAPTLVRFDEVGMILAGKLVAVQEVEVRGKMVVQYILHDAAGKVSKFLGTADLESKLGPQHRFCDVRIKYLGVDPTISKNDNAMKIFDVLVKEPPKRTEADITDDDLPPEFRE
jgi:hypothetical protein